jgi:hypothetical protein
LRFEHGNAVVRGVEHALPELQRAFGRIRQAAGFQHGRGRIDADAEGAVLADLLLQAVGECRHGRHCKASYGA